MVNFLFEKWGLFVYVPKFVYVLLLVHTYVCVCTGMHLYIYFCCLLMGRSGTKEEWVRKEEMDRCNQNFFWLQQSISSSLTHSSLLTLASFVPFLPTNR